VKTLAKFIKESKYFMAYTGAGISTSAGIPDFRGPEGVWTLRAKGITRTEPSTPRGEANPTFCHMALVKLQQEGILKHLVSQNCDGLHLISGIHPDNISELHGNCHVEACSMCGRVYYRSKRVRSDSSKERLTGRNCESTLCKGRLRYTTVAFSQSMPDLCLEKAARHSSKADVALCLGTSMRVSPACKLPTRGKKTNSNHKLVIVNLQKTPSDDDCALRIFARVDEVMEMLMKELNLEVPKWNKRDLVHDEKWMNDFSQCWAFRRPNNDWFQGPH